MSIWESYILSAVDKIDVDVCGVMDGMDSKIRDDDCSLCFWESDLIMAVADWVGGGHNEIRPRCWQRRAVESNKKYWRQRWDEAATAEYWMQTVVYELGEIDSKMRETWTNSVETSFWRWAREIWVWNTKDFELWTRSCQCELSSRVVTKDFGLG